MSIILTYVIIGFILIILLWIVSIEYRLKNFFAGTKARNLEEVMIELGNQLAEAKEFENKTKEKLSLIDARLNKSIRNVQTVRFNPFVEAGG
ncbi:MAG: DUF4446 family protein, partial [Candidatus Pacebacteria bacterium]|nr:DUF4446 family protein [Candidatus Paceibacterota bacterium]